MKTSLFLSLFGILFLTGNLCGQDYYMYIDGKKHQYKVSPEKMLVRYLGNDIDSVKIKNYIQKMTIKPKNVAKVCNDFALVNLENVSKEKVINLIEQWNISEKDTYASPIVSGDDDFEMSFIPDQLLVRIKQENDNSLLLKKIQSYNVKAIKLCEFDKKTYLITLTDIQRKNSLQVANELYETGLFDYAEPNVFHFVKRTTADTFFQQQWALHSNIAGIRAEQAWAITTGSPNVRIAIFDSGVDLNHPDLADNLLQGFNASTGALNGDVEYRDSQYEHGTACAGIVAAIANNGEGVAGVAHKCKILPIYDGMLTNAMAAAINWAIQNDASVISISNTYGETNALNIAINEATTNGRNNLGCVIVAASGNEKSTTVSYPARRLDVIAVGAITNNGTRWSESSQGSNYGTNLDVVAPGGAGIYTTDIRGNLGYNTSNGANGDYYSGFGGTSAACPHVAGVAALILSVRPDLTQAQVRHAIESTCTKITPSLYTYSNNLAHQNGTWHEQVGHGLVNAYAAVYSVAPRISGPATVCSTNTTPFTLNNADGIPADSVKWTCSSNLQKYPAGNLTGKSIVFRPTGNGAGWVQATVYGTPLTRYNIWCGLPNSSNIVMGVLFSDPPYDKVCRGRTVTIGVSSGHDPLERVTEYEWGFGSWQSYITGYDTNPVYNIPKAYVSIRLDNYAVSSQIVSVTPRNACSPPPFDELLSLPQLNKSSGQNAVQRSIPEAGKMFYAIACAGGYSISYPNPVSNILNIEIDADAATQQVFEQTTAAKQLKQDKTFDIRLYDGQGNLLRQKKTKGGAVQFNVASLPAGIYYLHIYDGVNGTPEMRQIVVER